MAIKEPPPLPSRKRRGEEAGRTVEVAYLPTPFLLSRVCFFREKFRHFLLLLRAAAGEEEGKGRRNRIDQG